VINQVAPESSGSQDEVPATVADTRAALLTRSKRDFTPVNKLFVQAPQGSAERHGPLSIFIKHGDHRGLLTYLFILAITSSGDQADGWSTTLPLSVWARALGTTETATGAAATAAVSKVLTRLENRYLIRRERRGRERKVRVTLLREDASSSEYTRPGKGNTDRFLRLSHRFWLDEWSERLSLPALAMLLVALHEKPGFELPTERMPDWYGWSADTAERGFAQLEEHGLLLKTSRLVKAPLSPTGITRVNQYWLQPPFKQPAPPKAAKKSLKRKRAASRRTGQTVATSRRKKTRQ
jgi:hypothetical protein